MRKTAAFLLVTALAGCAFGRFGSSKNLGEVVEAEGWAPIDSSDMPGTKRRSLIEAQKKAVERVVGVYISGKTRVAQAVHVDQNILAKVDGYIQKYDVLSEKQEDGFYKTRIKARVLYKKVGEDLKSLGLARPEAPPGNPRVVVLMQTAGPWSEAREGAAAGAVRRALLERGFSVVDRNDPMAFGSRKSTEAVVAVSVGRELRADLVVRGEAEVHELQGMRLGGFHSWRARVALEALRPGSGQVISRKTVEASGLDPSPEIAAAKALENAGMLAGEAVSLELSQTLKSGARISIVLLGVKDLGQVQQIAEDIRILPEVSDVMLSEYRDHGAQLEATAQDMTGEQLAAALLQMKKYEFSPRAVTSYSVELALK